MRKEANARFDYSTKLKRILVVCQNYSKEEIAEKYGLSNNYMRTNRINAYKRELEKGAVTLAPIQKLKIKATTQFKGRNYIAWFTTELPFPFGPWKLHGLPGLILSAHDDKQEVIFSYAGFDKENVDKLIDSPSYAIRASSSELNKLKKAFKDNPAAYYAALQSSGRMALTNDYYGIDYGKMSINVDYGDYKPSLNGE